MFCFNEFAFTIQVKQKINSTQILGFILINTKNCSLSIVLTATDQKPQKSLKR